MDQHLVFIGLCNMGGSMAGRLLDAGCRLTGAVRELWARAERELGPAQDLTEIVKMLERAAGVEVRSVFAAGGDAPRSGS